MPSEKCFIAETCTLVLFYMQPGAMGGVEVNSAFSSVSLYSWLFPCGMCYCLNRYQTEALSLDLDFTVFCF